MTKITEKKAKKILERYAPNNETYKKVLRHSEEVKGVAIKIAKNIKGIDINFIRTAAILHDIGRFRCPPNSRESIKHGIEGAKILRKEGLNKHALVAERHLGAGITKEDIIKQKLDLPLKDYVPISNEEKIICHADNLVFGDKEVNFKRVIARYKKELGKKYVRRLKRLKDEIEKMEYRNK